MRNYLLVLIVLTVLLVVAILVPAVAQEGGVSSVVTTCDLDIRTGSIALTGDGTFEGTVSKVELSPGISKLSVGDYWIQAELTSPSVKFISTPLDGLLEWSSRELDITWEYLDTSLKETIVVKDSSIKSLTYKMDCNGELEVQSDGSISLMDYGYCGLPLLGILAPTATDAGDTPVEVVYSLEGGALRLDIAPGIGTPLKYPITIDPSYLVYSASISSAISTTDQRKIVILADGTWVVSFLDSNPEEVWVIYSTDEGETWSGAEQIDGSDGYDKEDIGIVASPGGDVFVYWTDVDRQGIYGVLGTGSPLSWGSVETCIDRTDPDDDPSASMDSAGGIHLVWRAYNLGGTSNYDIGYIYRDPSTGWGSPYTLCTYSGYTQYYPNITVDSSDDLHVVWTGMGGSPVNPGYRNIYYVKRTSLVWGSEEYLTDEALWQYRPSVCVDSSDIPCVAWYGRLVGSVYQIYYMDKEGGSWNPYYQITDASGSQMSPSIGRTALDEIVVCWYGVGWGTYPARYQSLVAIKSPNDTWGSPQLLTDSDTHNIWANLLYSQYRVGQIPTLGFALLYISYSSYDITLYKSDDFSLTPVIVSVDPDNGRRYESLDEVEISGGGFASISSVDFGTDVSVDSYTVLTTERIICDLTIFPEAPLGEHDVTVTSTLYGTGTLVNGFTVKGKGDAAVLLIALIGLAGFLTFMTVKVRFLPVSIAAGMAWLALGILLLLDPDTIGLDTVSTTWVQVLGFIFLLMTVVPLLLQMRYDIRHESKVRGTGEVLSWGEYGKPPGRQKLSREEASTQRQQDYRNRLRGRRGE
jgi:hypothetical protein